MSICGIGVDIIEIPRIKKAHERWGESFLQKIFTDDEIKYCLRKVIPYPSLAARFAAKEAGFKALSQAGFHVTLWRSIYVTRSLNGRPHLNVDGLTGIKLHLALSHSKDSAIAMVVAEHT